MKTKKSEPKKKKVKVVAKRKNTAKEAARKHIETNIILSKLKKKTGTIGSCEDKADEDEENNICDINYEIEVDRKEGVWSATVPCLDVVTYGDDLGEALAKLEGMIEYLISKKNVNIEIKLTVQTNNIKALNKLRKQRMKAKSA